jgi:hypothetical protein
MDSVIYVTNSSGDRIIAGMDMEVSMGNAPRWLVESRIGTMVRFGAEAEIFQQDHAIPERPRRLASGVLRQKAEEVRSTGKLLKHPFWQTHALNYKINPAD